jgi:hypothetical protein
MSYTLKLTNGTILLTLADQHSDRITTSLTMIGKNVNAYGTDLNDNFIHLLENFSSVNRPINPLEGQLWFNATDQRIYVYAKSPSSSNDFKPVGGPIIGSTLPYNVSTGDFWFDTSAKQLKFLASPGNLFTIGPAFDAAAGKSGLIVETTATTVGPASILELYIDGQVLGVVSTDQYTFSVPYNGITTATAGINLIPGYKFVGTATFAETLISPTTGALLTADSFFRKDTYPIYTQGFTVANDFPGVIIGSGTDIQLCNTGSSILATSPVATLKINGLGQDFNLDINPLTTSTRQSAVYIDSSNSRIGVFNTKPLYPVDITGNVNINGNLIVTGSSTYITSADLRIESKVVELSSGTITNDGIANGGGVKLFGDSVKSVLWSLSNNAWTSNVNFDIDSTSTYKIGGVSVVQAGGLSSSVTASSLTSVGNLVNGTTIGQITFSTSTIGTTNFVPLYLGNQNTANIDFGGNTLQNVTAPPMGAGPSFAQYSNYAATKGYVDGAISNVLGTQKGQFSTTIDVTGHAQSLADPELDIYVQAMLNMLYPSSSSDPSGNYGIYDGARARVIVTRYTSYGVPSVASDFINFGNPVVLNNTSTEVIAYSQFIRAVTTLPVTPIGINRGIKQYILSSGIWIAYIVTGTGSNIIYTDGTW